MQECLGFKMSHASGIPRAIKKQKCDFFLQSEKRSSEKLKDPQGQQSASRVRLPDVQFEIVKKRGI